MSERDFEDHADAATAWWRALQPDREGRGGDRAALARLRRAELATAMAEAATVELFRDLRLPRQDQERLPRVAVIAHVLAHVREEAEPVMRRVGCVPGGDPAEAALKPMRFRRLLACRKDEDLMREMRRLVLLADRRLDVGHLAASLLRWDDRTRAFWAFDYFGAERAAPPLATTAAGDTP